MSDRKNSIISEVTRTGDEFPSIIAKLTNASHPHHSSYPFSRVLRIRVLQIVCGISVLIMGSVACIEDQGSMTSLGIGVPAGILTVVAAGASIHTSRGFSGYRSTSWSQGSSLRAFGPNPQIAAALVALWTLASTLQAVLFLLSLLTINKSDNYRQSQTRYQLAVVELFLSGLTLGGVLEVLRVDLRHDPD